MAQAKHIAGPPSVNFNMAQLVTSGVRQLVKVLAMYLDRYWVQFHIPVQEYYSVSFLVQSL